MCFFGLIYVTVKTKQNMRCAHKIPVAEYNLKTYSDTMKKNIILVKNKTTS